MNIAILPYTTTGTSTDLRCGLKYPLLKLQPVSQYRNQPQPVLCDGFAFYGIVELEGYMLVQL